MRRIIFLDIDGVLSGIKADVFLRGVRINERLLG